jgi:glycosyltransferase involved in cell wall biosynthesis
MLAARIAYSFSIRWNKGENAVKARLYWERVSGVIPQNEKKYDAAISYAQGIPTFYAAEKARAKKKFAWVNTSYRLAAEERTYQRFFYQQFHQIITVSQPAKDIFLQTFPEYAEKTTVIYDILNYDFILQLADAVHPFDEPFHGIRILTIGRLAGEKGYDIALEAGKKLKEKGIDFKWHIIGQGPLKGEIWKYIKKNDLTDCFILMGITENPYPFIKNAHIYVQTSRYEGFGLAIAEARMLNIPVVATNFDAVHDQIIDGKNGLIVEMNAEAVCKGILKLIDDRTLRDNIKARLRAEKKGNMEEIEKIDQLIG